MAVYGAAVRFLMAGFLLSAAAMGAAAGSVAE